MATKSFSVEEKAEALRLLKDGHTLKEVAQQIGCSVASLQSWKKTAGGKKQGKKKKAKSSKKVAATETTAECDCESCCCISFEEFARGYWAEAPNAEKVLSLPPDMMPEAVQYINNVLKYAYDNLCGK
jgi:transposase